MRPSNSFISSPTRGSFAAEAYARAQHGRMFTSERRRDHEPDGRDQQRRCGNDRLSASCQYWPHTASVTSSAAERRRSEATTTPSVCSEARATKLQMLPSMRPAFLCLKKCSEPGLGMTEGITKSATGIEGFDDLTLGGLPTGRPTLVCGSAGCGKTLFASTFLFNGAKLYDEPGVFVTFEERPVDIVANVDLARLRPAGADRSVEDPYRAYRDRSLRSRRNRRLRPGGAVPAARIRRGPDRRQAYRARYDREPVLGVLQSGDPARRNPPPVRLAQAEGPDRGHHRRARRRHTDAARPRRICLRLRDPARSSRRQSDLHAALAHRQISRHRARHQRISVPDRRGRLLGAAGLLARPRSQGVRRAHLDRRARPRRHADRRRLLPRQQHPAHRRRRLRQEPRWPA